VKKMIAQRFIYNSVGRTGEGENEGIVYNYVLGEGELKGRKIRVEGDKS